MVLDLLRKQSSHNTFLPAIILTRLVYQIFMEPKHLITIKHHRSDTNLGAEIQNGSNNKQRHTAY